MRLRAIVLAVITVQAPLAIARAESVTHVASIPLQTTNWNQTIVVPKFDSSLGTLEKIIFKLDGGVAGSAAFESRDAASTTVHTQLSATLKLLRPDLSELVISTPVAKSQNTVTSWDGVDDFGGTSGMTLNGLSAQDVQTSTLMAPFSGLDAANFIGGPLDTITLPVQARGTSMGSGAGNLLLLFNTQAQANVMVTYEYVIPEPATGLLAFAALAILRRRRSS